MNNVKWIDTDNALIDFRRHLSDNGVQLIGMDFEAEYNRHEYGERLCLIQVFDGLDVYLIDALTISAEEVGKMLTNRRIKKVFFDAGSDTALVYKQFQVVVHPVIDLRVVAGVLDRNVGGFNAVLKNFLCLEILNKKRYQKFDWRTRPLPDEALHYATEDVRYLLALYDRLFEAVEAQKLTRQLASDLVSKGYSPDRQSRKNKPLQTAIERLSERQKTAYERIEALRQGIAMIENRPPEHILQREVVLKLATGRKKVGSIRQTKAVRPELHEMLTREIALVLANANGGAL